MAVEVKKLDLQIGNVVEIGGRRYDVVSDKTGGVALEPSITKTVEELRAEDGGEPLTTTSPASGGRSTPSRTWPS